MLSSAPGVRAYFTHWVPRLFGASRCRVTVIYSGVRHERLFKNADPPQADGKPALGEGEPSAVAKVGFRGVHAKHVRETIRVSLDERLSVGEQQIARPRAVRPGE